MHPFYYNSCKIQDFSLQIQTKIIALHVHRHFWYCEIYFLFIFYTYFMSLPTDGLETNKLFVGNLHRHVNRQELKDFFSQRGEVQFATVMLDRETNRSRWFGFITYVHAEDAVKAKAEAHEKELHGRPVYLEFAKAQAPREDAPEQSEESAE